jgi:hypothetical protein
MTTNLVLGNFVAAVLALTSACIRPQTVDRRGHHDSGEEKTSTSDVEVKIEPKDQEIIEAKFLGFMTELQAATDEDIAGPMSFLLFQNQMDLAKAFGSGEAALSQDGGKCLFVSRKELPETVVAALAPKFEVKSGAINIAYTKEFKKSEGCAAIFKEALAADFDKVLPFARISYFSYSFK